MGKKQHQSDKLYLTNKEWKEIGGHKDTNDTRVQRAAFKRLPFSHCALTFVPFKDPVCTLTGEIFDKKAILLYVKKQGINPVDGKKLKADQLIDLHFSYDNEGNFQCPVTFRTFTHSSDIVTIRTTGNVYSLDAVEELNLKRNHLKDLLTDVPFLKKDIIALQDPNNVEKFNMELFYHVQFNTRTMDEIAEEKRQMKNPSFFLNKIGGEAQMSLKALNEKYPDKVVDKIPVIKKKVAEKDPTDAKDDVASGKKVAPKPIVYSSRVGKFIKPESRTALKHANEKGSTDEEEVPKKKAVIMPFTNFSDW